MTLLHQQEVVVERDERSPIYSHESYEPEVHAICHHSGRYLTHKETNPTHWSFLREQHDFPGLPQLDRFFAKAAHSRLHQHWIWSRPTIQGLAMVLAGLAVFIMAQGVYTLRDFVPAGIWFILFLTLNFSWRMGSLVLIAGGIYLITRREYIFHQRAAGQPPAIADFPLQCNYDVDVHEKVTVNLGNTLDHPPKVEGQHCTLSVLVHPLENELESYDRYQEQYQGQGVGRYVHAGAVALDQLRDVAFTSGPVDFDHRLVLRTPAASVNLHQVEGRYEPFQVEATYKLLPSALYPRRNGWEHFPLECQPQLAADDSRTLELHFTWHGPNSQAGCRLEECTLEELGPLEPATGVEAGRYDQEKRRVIWRNRLFLNQQLVLRVTFRHPPIERSAEIRGRYKFVLDGLISNMQITSDHVWTARGLKAESDDSVIIINRQSVVQGQLLIVCQRLSQDHEHIAPTNLRWPLICHVPPNERAVRAVADVLQRRGFALQRVMRVAPRLNPAGSLDTQLYYWDIAGRRYDQEQLDSMEVHVVIAGHEQTPPLADKQPVQPETRIDVRVRCLHDPRNRRTPEAIDNLVAEGTEHSLIQEIEKAVSDYQAD
ncbi:MAG: hypothetical protein AB1791_06600 [Chloroflexota bacterium]